MEFDELEDDYTEQADLDEDISDLETEAELEFQAEIPDTGPEYAETIEYREQDDTEEARELSAEMLQALQTSPTERSWQQVELVDQYRHPMYDAQRSFATDPDTGEVFQDENGELLECPRNTPGAQRPDLYLKDENGIHLWEDKISYNLDALKTSIRKQTEDRRRAFGDDVNLTYVVAPTFTIEEADKLQDYCENRLGVHLDWQFK